MTGFVCDKCGKKAVVRDADSNAKALADGWVTLVSAVTNDKTDLCAACSRAWEELREPLLRRFLAGEFGK